MISYVAHVSIPVTDQTRALAFYTEKLGFEVGVDAEFPGGQRWIELKLPSGNTQVVLFTPEGHEDRIGTFSNIVFYTEDVRKTYQELKGKGVEFAEEPKEESWGTYETFKDPDGNCFLISST